MSGYEFLIKFDIFDRHVSYPEFSDEYCDDNFHSRTKFLLLHSYSTLKYKNHANTHTNDPLNPLKLSDDFQFHIFFNFNAYSLAERQPFAHLSLLLLFQLFLLIVTLIRSNDAS